MVPEGKSEAMLDNSYEMISDILLTNYTYNIEVNLNSLLSLIFKPAIKEV
jgi:hypothetical protein